MGVISFHNLTESLCSGERTGSQEIRFPQQTTSLTAGNYLISDIFSVVHRHDVHGWSIVRLY